MEVEILNKIIKTIPVEFEKIQQIDSRFTKVKIWLMHTGINYNKSSFDKSVVEAALETLKNNPILGFIQTNEQGEDDFSEHKKILEKKDGKWKFRYIGSAYGVIPETNNAQFEMRLCDDGVEREFLTCEGLIWNKWDNSTEILNRDLIKSQSMELHDDYEGYLDDDGVFHFTKFSFFGACILGKDFKPGMANATVEVTFSKDKVLSDIEAHLTEFQSLMQQRHEIITKGGMEVDEQLELLKKYNLTVEQAAEAGIVLSEFSSLENLEEKLKEFTDAKAAEATKIEPADNPSPEATKTDFATSTQQLTREIVQRLLEDGGSTTDEWGWCNRNYYYVDHTDSLVIADSKEDGWMLVGINYTMNVDVPVIDFASKKRFTVDYVPLEGSAGVQDINFVSKGRQEYEANVAKKEVEKEFSAKVEEKEAALAEVTTKFTEAEAKLTEATERVTALESEATELRNFKLEMVGAQRKESVDGVFSKFAQLDEAEVAQMKQEAYESDAPVGEIEEKLFALVGRKFAQQNFSASNKKNQTLRIGITGGDKAPEKPYADIIRKYSDSK